eukprot:CAMPEP_0175213464 /NCGR_PEP_ID=MMETSP0093-20121207/16203_1 /TAXON_ID=311494 /ORGANISM="Alexandrium monilatum, Strain CCMP3105" /LENGTH=51 /DNA_ID=CAMNT_0016506783 /DNA_START=222 /DNA_END=374 /DNA_ORIENTATION=+
MIQVRCDKSNAKLQREDNDPIEAPNVHHPRLVSTGEPPTGKKALSGARAAV